MTYAWLNSGLRVAHLPPYPYLADVWVSISVYFGDSEPETTPVGTHTHISCSPTPPAECIMQEITLPLQLLNPIRNQFVNTIRARHQV